MFSIFKIFLISATISLCGGSPLCAEIDFQKSMEKSIEAMRGKDWQRAIDQLQPIIDKHGTDGVKVYDAHFGSVYYNLGYSEMKLAEALSLQGKKAQASALLKSATTNFQACHSIKSRASATNPFRVKSLLYLGKSLQQLNQFGQALEYYDKFLLEKNSALDFYHHGNLLINMAICHWKKKPQDLAKGRKSFQRALALRGYHTLEADDLINGLEAMSRHHIEAGKGNELAEFIRLNLSNLKAPSAYYWERTPSLRRCIMDAAKADLPQAAKAIGQFIPDSEILQNELARLNNAYAKWPEQLLPEAINPNGYTKEQITQWISLLERQNRANLSLESHLQVIEQLGYARGAYAGYCLLANSYPKEAEKEIHLYNLIRTSAIAGDIDMTANKAELFAKLYPESELLNNAYKLAFTSLYFSGNYDACIRFGADRFSSLPAKSAIRNIALYTLAGSYYYKGSFEKSIDLLSTQLKEYPKSEYRDAVRYFYASSLSLTNQWEKAEAALDQYISDYSSNSKTTYLPFAIYDRAYTHYNQSQYDDAIRLLQPFENHTYKSAIEPQALILLGNIYYRKKNRDAAENAYKLALTSATKNDRDQVGDEAQYLLISMLGRPRWNGAPNERIKEAIPYYDYFMSQQIPKKKKSIYYTQIVNAAQAPLRSAGKFQEATDALENAIFIYNTKPNTPGIEPAIHSYIIQNINKETPINKLISRLLKKIPNTAYNKNLLKVAQIHYYKKLNLQKQSLTNQIRSKTLLLELSNINDLKSLDNFSLLALGDFTQTVPALKKRAPLYFQAILDSGSSLKRQAAHLALAEALIKNGTTAQAEKAEKIFLRILNDPVADPKAQASAHYFILKSLAKQAKWKELGGSSLLYFKRPIKYRDHTGQVQDLLALSYDRQNKPDAALSAYTRLWVDHFFSIKHSARAIERTVDLLWQRNNPADEKNIKDRQLAYETAYKYIHKTAQTFDLQKESLDAEVIATYKRIKDKANDLAEKNGIRKIGPKL